MGNYADYDVSITTKVRVTSTNAEDALKLAIKHAEGTNVWSEGDATFNGAPKMTGGTITLIEKDNPDA